MGPNENRTSSPRVDVVAAVVRQNGKVLLADRPSGKPPYGWEFPGGKREPGETLNEALKRELQEELGVDSLPLDLLYVTDVGRIRLHFIRTLLPQSAVPQGREGQSLRWADLHGGIPKDLLSGDLDFWKFLTFFETETIF